MDNDLKIIYGVWIFIIASLMILPLVSSSPALTDNITSYWKLDESSGNAIDSHGSHDGTVIGATQNVSGKINTAYDFDGTEDYVNISDSDDWDATDGISISGWYYADTIGVWNAMINQWDSTAAASSSWTIETVGADFRFYIYDGAAKFASSSGTAVTGRWIFVVGVYEGDGETNGLKIYVNGTLGGTTATITTANTAAFPLRIGDFYDTINAWDGRIDEVAIWSRALTQEEVTELWNNNDPPPYPFVEDTCTCPGAGNNWEIAMSDYCNITEACNLTTGHLNFTGAGYCNCNSTITTTNLGDPGSTGILYIQDSCTITID